MDPARGNALEYTQLRTTRGKGLPRLILQPASNPEAQRHYAATIKSGVPLERIAPHVTPSLLERLKSIYPSGRAHVWGATAGKANARQYNEMQESDLLLFYKHGQFFESFRVALKMPENRGNRDLARSLWGSKRDMTTGDLKTWEHVFFLANRKPLVPPINYREMHAVIQFGPADKLWALTVLDEKRSHLAFHAFDLL